MKRLLYNIFYLLLVNSFAINTYAAQTIEKSKKINRTYQVKTDETLNITNEFGKVHVNTWDKKEIMVDITILAICKTNEKADYMIDRVKFSENRAGGTIYLNTSLQNKILNLSAKESIRINYTIYMPADNSLSLQNKFGDVYLADFSGPLNLNLSYGQFKAAKIKNAAQGAKIKVAFGGADINSIDQGIIDVSYSKLSIDEANQIEVSNMFGKTEIGSVRNLEINQKYGNLELTSVNQIRGRVEFANVDIDKVGKSVELILKYCGKSDFGTLSNSVDLIKIDADFSSIYCSFDDDASFTFNIDQKYGDFNRMTPKITELKKEAQVGRTQPALYRGKIGKGGAAAIILDVSYGDVYFN